MISGLAQPPRSRVPVRRTNGSSTEEQRRIASDREGTRSPSHSTQEGCTWVHHKVSVGILCFQHEMHDRNSIQKKLRIPVIAALAVMLAIVVSFPAKRLVRAQRTEVTVPPYQIWFTETERTADADVNGTSYSYYAGQRSNGDRIQITPDQKMHELSIPS